MVEFRHITHTPILRRLGVRIHTSDGLGKELGGVFCLNVVMAKINTPSGQIAVFIKEKGRKQGRLNNSD